MSLRFNLVELRKAYARGENITEKLRGENEFNSLDAIEVAYDLQAGSYTKKCLEDFEGFDNYTSELASILKKYILPFDSICDCGTGEMTTLSGISRYLSRDISIKAFDISLSRILFGKKFVDRMMRVEHALGLIPFCASIDNIPLPGNSVDVVFTSHALEPNRGRELQLLRELFRIGRRIVVLFEPSYEQCTDEARLRMDRLGYVRDLPKHIKDLGFELKEFFPINNISNPLNPTYCHVIQLRDDVRYTIDDTVFVCPISDEILVRMSGYYWSEGGGMPILK